MKILQVGKLYAPWIGGVEKATQQLAEGLAQDFEMTVLCCQPKGKAAEETWNGVRVVRAASYGMWWGMPISFDFFAKFRALARESDLIHIHLPFPLAVFAWFFNQGALSEKPIVTTYHSDIIRQKFVSPLLNPFLVKFFRDTRTIVASSPALSEHSQMLRQFREKVIVVPFGVDLGAYELTLEMQKQVNAVKSRFRMPIILYAGRLNYYKGVRYLLEAMQHMDAMLLIAGDGEEAARLRAYAKSLNLLTRVSFLGRVDDEELKVLLHACDIFVLPSTHPSEAFGLVQLEAMACGKPVINTSLPTGVPWVSVHNETGLTVPPKNATALADALNALLRNPELRMKLGAQARTRAADRFTLQKMLESHKRIYQEAAS